MKMENKKTNEEIIIEYVLNFFSNYSGVGLNVLIVELQTVLKIIRGMPCYDVDKIIRIVFTQNAEEDAADA